MTNDGYVKQITHKGGTYTPKTKKIKLISDEEFKRVKKEWYVKPDKQDVYNEIVNLLKNNTIANITRYYYRELMDNTIYKGCKWCINDVFENKELLSYYMHNIKSNDVFFSENETEMEHLDKAFRLGGGGVATKVSQFPIKVVNDILNRYNVNGNYYDFSCGWGCRLAGSMRANVNYFGTDPNYLLVEKLYEFAIDFNIFMKSRMFNIPDVDIRCQGSEIFIPEWENKMGLAFSSPPYFDLEDYRIGEQSYITNETSYDSWLYDYMEPTIQNIYKYLIDDGFFIINIKNTKEHKLEDDTVKLSLKNGFELYKKENMKQTSDRVSSKGELVDSSEYIFVFRKKGSGAEETNVQLEFDLGEEND